MNNPPIRMATTAQQRAVLEVAQFLIAGVSDPDLWFKNIFHDKFFFQPFIGFI